LRDQAGLIVIDFIDMESNRNNSLVEKRLKEAMRHDRARIQIGSISPFGLLEMSRQRLRMSLIETSSEPCPYCEGTGIRRSTDSSALVVLRTVQEEANNKETSSLIVYVPTAVALYILNQKRQTLADIERSTDVSIILNADESLVPPALRVERLNADGKIELITQTTNNETPPAEEKVSRRKRRPRRRASSEVAAEKIEDGSSENNSQNKETNEAIFSDDESNEDKNPKRRRRGKRGGRRRRGRPEEDKNNEENSTQSVTEDKTSKADINADQDGPVEQPIKEVIDGKTDTITAKKRVSRRRSRKTNSEKKTTPTDAVTQTFGNEPDVSNVIENVTEPSQSDTKNTTGSQKTTVINVGDGSREVEDKPKKGWWWPR